MRRQIWTYIVLCFSITWVLVLSLYFLYTRQIITRFQLDFFFSFGALGPFLSAMVCARHFYGKTGMKKLFNTLALKKLNAVSLLLSLSPFLFGLLGGLLYPLLSGKEYSFVVTQQQFHLTNTMSYLGWALPFFTYGVLEEFGWRGYVLPHLQERFTALQSSALLAFIWALWHAPFFLFRFQFSIGLLVGFVMGLFVGALILTAIFNTSKGSVLACIIFHLSNNLVSALDKTYIVAAVSTGFMVLALYLIWKYKPTNLAGEERTKNYFKSLTSNFFKTPY